MGKHVSIVDVARHAGVSVSTVSLVMNNRPNVAPDTASAVWHSVRELGYRAGGDGKKRGPKPGPRKSRQITAVGLLMTGMPGSYLWRSLYLQAMQGVQAALAEKDLSLVLYHIADVTEVRHVLQRTHLDGIMLFGQAPDDVLAQFLRRQVCVQVFGSPPAEGLWDVVSCDNRAAGHLAAQYLLGRGHRHLAYIGRGTPIARERGDAFALDVQAAAGKVEVVHDHDLIAFEETAAVVNRRRLAEIARSLLCRESDDGPSGIFLCSDLLAAGFYSILYEQGLLPTKRYDLVCCNGHCPHLLAVYPPPAIIDVFAEQVGRQAVDQALWRRDHRHEPCVVRLLTPRLQVPPELV